MRRFSLTWLTILGLAACGVFGWGSSFRSHVGNLIAAGSWDVDRGFVVPTNEDSFRILRRRVPDALPIYVLRGEPLSEAVVETRRGGVLMGYIPDQDAAIHPTWITVAAQPRELRPLTLSVTTVYDGTSHLGENAPFYVLRPSPGVQVEVFVTGIGPATSRAHVRGWLRMHLEPY